jgi:hypothetical protein
MYELLDNGQILTVEEVKTKRQTAIVKSHYAYRDKVAITATKTVLQVGEVSNIAFKWQEFNLSDGMHKDNPTNSSPITAKINGQEIELTSENGRAELEFSSDEPGQYEITTTALETDTIIVEVV